MKLTKANFTLPLLNWYYTNQRQLLFRQDKNPYHIWVSEIMAQQTQIDTMLPYFKRWIQKWPTISDLAQANENEVLKMWEGLGYYSRARNLYQSALFIQEQFNGEFPHQFQDIINLKGIGDYSASAISAIAFEQPTPAIDGNVIRVMSRVKTDNRDFLAKTNKENLKQELRNLMTDNQNGDFVQALMELGALTCTVKNPKCKTCPLNQVCLAAKHQQQDNFPIKKIKKQNPIIYLDVFINIQNGQILISKDDSDNLMTGLIRLPFRDYNLTNPLFKHKHVFSHKTWLLHVYDISIQPNDKESWIDLDQLKKLPMVTAHKKILEQYLLTQHSQAI